MNYLKLNFLAIINIALLFIITFLKLVSSLIKALSNIVIYALGFLLVYMLCDVLLSFDISVFLEELGALLLLIIVCIVFLFLGLLIFGMYAIVFSILAAIIAFVNSVRNAIANIICFILDYIIEFMIKRMYYTIYNAILKDENYECIFTSVYSLENNGNEFVKINASINKEADRSKCIRCLFVNVLAFLEIALNVILNKKNWFGICMTLFSLGAFIVYQNSLTIAWLNVNYFEFLSCFHWTDICITVILIVYLLMCVFHMSHIINKNMNNYLDFINKIIERKEISLE